MTTKNGIEDPTFTVYELSKVLLEVLTECKIGSPVILPEEENNQREVLLDGRFNLEAASLLFAGRLGVEIKGIEESRGEGE